VTITPLSVSSSKGQRVTFTCSANGVGVDSFVYGWLLNGVPIDGRARKTLTVTTSTDNSGNYQCIVRNRYNGFGRSPAATLILSELIYSTLCNHTQFLSQDQFCDPVTVPYTGFIIRWDKTLVGATVEKPCTGPGLNGNYANLNSFVN